MKRAPKTPALVKLAMLLLFAIAAVAILDTNTISAQELGRTITSPFGIARQTSASESGSEGDTFVDPETGEVGHIIRNPFGVANPEGVDTGIDIPDSGEEEVGGIITNPFGVPDPDGVDTDVFNEDVDNEYCISLPEDEEYDIEEVLKEIEAAEGITTDGDVTTKTPFPPKDAPKNTGEDPQSYILEAFTLSMGFDNPLISDGASIPKLYVFAGDSIYVSLKTPLGSTPLNYTTWEITADSSSPSSSGVEDLTSINMPPLGAQNYTFHVPNSSYGKYLLTVKGYKNGTLISRKIDIVVFSLEIGKAIRRGNPINDWENNRLLIYAPIPTEYTMRLTLEKTDYGPGTTGDCAFLLNPTGAPAGTLFEPRPDGVIDGKMMRIKTAEGMNEYHIKGIGESKIPNDIILRIIDIGTGNIFAQRSFIVYSQIIDKDFEDHLPIFLQHKDTDEACTSCPQHYTYNETHQSAITHPNNPFCPHCQKYCARACLKVMKGSNQDDYKHLQLRYNPALQKNIVVTTLMYQNHNSGLSASEIVYYLGNIGGFINVTSDYFEDKYNLVLKYLFYNGAKKFIGGVDKEFNALNEPTFRHAFIIYGCYWNTKEGEITNPKIKIWDPWNGSTSDEYEYENGSFCGSQCLGYLFFQQQSISDVNI